MEHVLGETGTGGDGQLIVRIGGGDRTAFSELVRRHQSALYRYVRALTRNDADAEDALQRTFLSVWRSAASLRSEASEKSWLFTIARNAAFRQMRPRPESPMDPETLASLGENAGFGDDLPDDVVQRFQERARLEAALERLPLDEQEVLVLRDLEGLSGEDTAWVLGVSLAAMKSRLHRGRLRLLAELKEHP